MVGIGRTNVTHTCQGSCQAIIRDTQNLHALEKIEWLSLLYCTKDQTEGSGSATGDTIDLETWKDFRKQTPNK